MSTGGLPWIQAMAEMGVGPSIQAMGPGWNTAGTHAQFQPKFFAQLSWFQLHAGK